jgi:glycine C-acetyltransferase
MRISAVIMRDLSRTAVSLVKDEFLRRLAADTERLREQGLYKVERVLASPQQARVRVSNGTDVLNLCANNYLGLANHPAVREAAHRGIDRYGYGMASVRFICGTQTIHKELEERLSHFLGTDDTILYSSCFDANGGLFETLLDEQDAVISDALNHASIIDGIRLCKAERLRYANSDLDELEKHLKATQGKRTRLIATDGVFSMDGTLAKLKELCDLADRYGALVMVDDSHAVGFMGATGRGMHEYCGVLKRIDILTGTLGKALGGASGGYTSGRREIIGWLRQRSRPYLFSNSIPPVVAAVGVRVLDLLQGSPEFRERLFENTRFFRQQMTDLGLQIVPGEHPIIPIMLGDARIAVDMADRLLAEGVYVIGFSFPVVPQGKARIRTQMSAGLSRQDLERAVSAFQRVARAMNLIH